MEKVEIKIKLKIKMKLEKNKNQKGWKKRIKKFKEKVNRIMLWKVTYFFLNERNLYCSEVQIKNQNNVIIIKQNKNIQI